MHQASGGRKGKEGYCPIDRAPAVVGADTAIDPAHFHALYVEHEATIAIASLAMLTGELPRRATALVLEWSAMHRRELQANWERARQGLPLDAIDPLD